MEIITNNPKVIRYASQNAYKTTVACSLMDVLYIARDLVHRKYQLVNHPLVTSIKPYKNLYKTIVVSQGKSLDMQSLRIIENSIQKTLQFQKDVPLDDKTKQDYQLIDFGVFKQSIDKIEL